MNDMDNIIVISQNVKLESLSKLKEYITPNSETLIVSTQLIFENEAELIDNILESKCKYINFSDLLTDAELEACDTDAFQPDDTPYDIYQFDLNIKVIKNQRIIKKISERYSATNKLVVCDDLGIYLDEWLKAGYRKIDCEYYYVKENVDTYTPAPRKRNWFIKILRTIRNVVHHVLTDDHLSVAYFKGTKYVFWGSLNRIAYRTQLEFKPAGYTEYLRSYVDKYVNTQPNTIRLSTFHEGYNKWSDKEGMNVYLMQDGYLPPNYTSNYLYYYGKHTTFYTWDKLGTETFLYFHLPCKIMPFRKKLYLPKPNYPNVIKKVLCVASGAGDWTAIKNRSDEDKMLQAFGIVAKKFPDIEFVYRCHPVWIHPEYQGVNSINRAANYIEWLNLPNLKLSSNIPNANESNGFRHSFNRNSFAEDMKDADIIFGEHSVSMLDGGFQKKVFCSVNVTGRRDLFAGITALGFPHCESISEIVKFINSVGSDKMVCQYHQAIDNYNRMTDQED